MNHWCLEVVVVLARSSTGEISCLKPCGMAMYNARWRSQVFTSWCREIQTNFLFTEIAVFLVYMEIYVHIFVITKQSIQHIDVCIVLTYYGRWFVNTWNIGEYLHFLCEISALHCGWPTVYWSSLENVSFKASFSVCCITYLKFS